MHTLVARGSIYSSLAILYKVVQLVCTTPLENRRLCFLAPADIHRTSFRPKHESDLFMGSGTQIIVSEAECIANYGSEPSVE